MKTLKTIFFSLFVLISFAKAEDINNSAILEMIEEYNKNKKTNESIDDIHQEEEKRKEKFRNELEKLRNEKEKATEESKIGEFSEENLEKRIDNLLSLLYFKKNKAKQNLTRIIYPKDFTYYSFNNKKSALIKNRAIDEVERDIVLSKNIINNYNELRIVINKLRNIYPIALRKSRIEEMETNLSGIKGKENSAVVDNSIYGESKFEKGMKIVDDIFIADITESRIIIKARR